MTENEFEPTLSNGETYEETESSDFTPVESPETSGDGDLPSPEDGQALEPPVEVISVDALLSRLQEASDVAQDAGNTAALMSGDVPVGEPVIDVVDVVLDILDELQEEETYRNRVQTLLTDIHNHQIRPALTTNFEDYTVSEALLLLLLLYFITNKCLAIVKEGFSWLMS